MSDTIISKTPLKREVISPKFRWWNLHLEEIWQYRDLLFLFVRRDFVSVYKQTILGPVWFIIQPILATIVFSIIFGKVAALPTDGRPMVVFYLVGITAWTYFADSLNRTSHTFTDNTPLFGKVYFPRLIMPLSVIISSLIKFGMQFLLMLAVLTFYFFRGANIDMNAGIFLTPILIMIMAGLGLGFGIIITSLTTRYKDLQFLIQFGVQMLMYATPVVYPLSMVPDKYQWVILANPMTAIIEAFRAGFLGVGTTEPIHLLYSFTFMIVLLIVGVAVFQRVERNFIDTI